MTTTIWRFVAIVDDTDGQEIKVDVALRLDRIQSIVKETDDSVVIYCDRGLSWKPYDWDFDLLVRAWESDEPLNEAMDICLYRNWSDDPWWRHEWERHGEPDNFRKSEFLHERKIEKGWIDLQAEIDEIIQFEYAEIGKERRSLRINGLYEWSIGTVPWSEQNR